jgi:hypothetical protein
MKMRVRHEIVALNRLNISVYRLNIRLLSHRNLESKTGWLKIRFL